MKWCSIVWLCILASGYAHRTIYHNIEVNLTKPDRLTIYVTIHESDVENGDSLQFIEQTFGLTGGFQFDHLSADLPEDCHLATLELSHWPNTLRIDLAPDSAKRLMLVVVKPRQFPKTHDLAPGNHVILELPRQPALNLGWILAIIGALGGIMLICARWRRPYHRSKDSARSEWIG